MTTLNDKDYKEAKNLFESFDKEGNGWIEAKAIKPMFKEFNESLSDTDIEAILAQNDLDPSGKVTLDQFMELIGPFIEVGGKFDDIFDEFDTDGDGKITKKELHDALDSLGAYSKEEIDAMFQQTDLDGDGQITREEFTKFFN